MKLHEKFQAINQELGTQLYERHGIIEAISLGLLSGHNVYLLGVPGTAKSLTVRLYASRVTGANYWEVLLDKQLPQESLFGPIDIIEFKKTGKYHRAVDGYLPTAHFAFLDEVGKAGPAVLNPLLTLLNEGMYHNNSKPMKVNLRVAVGASNEELEPELGAMRDRWLITKIVHSIQEPSNFVRLLTQEASQPKNPTTVSLEEVDQARDEVKTVTVPDGVADKLLELKLDLESDQIRPSDRRWRQSMDVLRANAWLNGRSEIEEDDIAVLRDVLWDVVEQATTVEYAVLKHSSEFASRAITFDRELDDLEAGLGGIKGQSGAERAKYGAKAQAELAQIKSNVTDLIEKGKRQRRNVTRLEQTMDRVSSIRRRIYVECLDIPADKAANL